MIDYDECYGVLNEKPFSELFQLACDIESDVNGKFYYDTLLSLTEFIKDSIAESGSGVNYFYNSYGNMSGLTEFEKMKESLILYLMYNHSETLDEVKL